MGGRHGQRAVTVTGDEGPVQRGVLWSETKATHQRPVLAGADVAMTGHT